MIIFDFFFLPYAIFIFFLIMGIIAVELESNTILILGILTSLVMLKFLAHISVFTIIANNPTLIVAAVVGYIIIGSVYTLLITYPEFLKENQSQIKSAFESYKRKQKNEDISINAFMNSSENHWTPSKQKTRIMNMVFTWVFSFIWDIINKPVIWVFENVYHVLSKGFTKIMQKTIRKMFQQ